jgi:hypothetical protein
MKAQERDGLLRALKQRFEQNLSRHRGIPWEAVLARFGSKPAALKVPFVYHNGAQSYYASRAFRGLYRV